MASLPTTPETQVEANPETNEESQATLDSSNIAESAPSGLLRKTSIPDEEKNAPTDTSSNEPSNAQKSRVLAARREKIQARCKQTKKKTDITPTLLSPQDAILEEAFGDICLSEGSDRNGSSQKRKESLESKLPRQPDQKVLQKTSDLTNDQQDEEIFQETSSIAAHMNVSAKSRQKGWFRIRRPNLIRLLNLLILLCISIQNGCKVYVAVVL